MGVVQQVLNIDHGNVSYLDNLLLRRAWCDSKSIPELTPMAMINDGVVTAAASVGGWTVLEDCIPFLSVLFSGNQYLGLCIAEVKRHLTSEKADLRGHASHEPLGVVEPRVVYRHEDHNCQVPLAEVCLPELFSGSLG